MTKYYNPCISGSRFLLYFFIITLCFVLHFPRQCTLCMRFLPLTFSFWRLRRLWFILSVALFGNIWTLHRHKVAYNLYIYSLMRSKTELQVSTRFWGIVSSAWNHYITRTAPRFVKVKPSLVGLVLGLGGQIRIPHGYKCFPFSFPFFLTNPRRRYQWIQDF